MNITVYEMAFEMNDSMKNFKLSSVALVVREGERNKGRDGGQGKREGDREEVLWKADTI